MKVLVLGGARSGKSARAEALAKHFSRTVVYVATSPVFPEDQDWQQRIARHSKRRPDDWVLVEEPLNLVGLLQGAAYIRDILLIDCLTLWLSNVLHEAKDVEAEVDALCLALARYSGTVVMVSNEVGMGLVPESAIGRRFRDAQGLLNQRVAALADRVEFVAAGLAIPLKPQ